MKTWHYAILCLAALLGAGCRTDPNIAILERELRRQEDEIYRLEDCLDGQQASLEACRRENAALRRQLGDGEGQPAPSPSGSGPGLRAKIAPPADAVTQPPVVELPGPAAGQTKIPDSLRVPRAKPSEPEPSPKLVPPDGSQSRPPAARPPVTPASLGGPPAIRAENKQVQRIVLSHVVAGRSDGEGPPDDDGLTLLIETRDGKGRLLHAVAPVSIVVLDRRAEGDAARVARWDFSAEQVADLLSKTPPNQGIHLKLDWPSRPPAHGDLRLFVRYVTDDGRKLEADGPVEIQASAPPSKRWTPAKPKLEEPEPVATPSSPPREERAVSAPGGAGPDKPRRPLKRPAPPKPERQAQRPAWSPYR